MRGARVPDVGCLRKRADGRGREARQVEALLLHLGAVGIGAGAAPHRVIDAGDALRHVGIVNPRRVFARSRGGIGSLQRCLGLAVVAGKRRSRRRQFLDFLHGEGQPVLHLGAKARLQREIDRHVQERAGRRKLHALIAKAGDNRRETIEKLAQIGAPDIAAIDYAEREDAVVRHVGEVVDLLGCTHEIEM
jgi:hypothetical protein